MTQVTITIMLFSKLLWFMATATTASLAVMANAQLCPLGQDVFYSYVQVEFQLDGGNLDQLNLGDLFSRSYNELAALTCDYDHHRIHLSEIEGSSNVEMLSDGNTKLFVNIKAHMYYKGMMGLEGSGYNPTSILTLFGPQMFRNRYVEDGCNCILVDVEPTGVTSKIMAVALKNSIQNALEGKNVEVMHVEEVAVSLAKTA